MLPQPSGVSSASSSSSSPLQKTSSTSIVPSSSATLPMHHSTPSSNGQFNTMSNNIRHQSSSSIQGSVIHDKSVFGNNTTMIMTNNTGRVYINTTGAGMPSSSHTSNDARLSVTPNASLPSSTPVIMMPPPPVGTQHTTGSISTIKSSTTNIQGGLGGVVIPSTTIQGGLGGVMNPTTIQGGIGGVINPSIQGGLSSIVNPTSIQGGLSGVMHPSTSSSSVHNPVSGGGPKQGSDDVEEALRGLMDNGLLDLPFFTL